MLLELINQEIWANSVYDYLLAVVIFFVTCMAVKLFQRYLLRRLKRWAQHTATTIDDFIIRVVQKIVLPLLYFGAFILAVNTLNFPPLLRKIIDTIAMAVLVLFIVRLTTVLIGYVFDVYWRSRGQDKTLERSLRGILRVIKVIIWAVAIIFFLDNLGFKISAVIAGLGVGGVAIALAAQAILGDLFSYFSILFDRPFEIGDFIIVGEYLGTVDYIGIKTTRIRSLGGEQIVFSNSDLTNSRVRNYKRMGQRRVVFKLGVTYQTTLEQGKEIPGIIEKIVKGIKDTVFDRAHFFSYGDFSLIY